MKDFLNNLRDRYMRFMYGRYASDQLGMAIVTAAMVATVVTLFTHWRWLSAVALALLIYEVWRMHSRDIAARSRENEAFLSATEKPRTWVRRQRSKWANRKTRAYVRCPYCHTEFALPKGKGKLRATCPHCGQKSEHRV